MKRVFIIITMALAAPATAGELSDRILGLRDTMAELAPGTVVARYSHDQRLPPPAAQGEAARPDLEGAVVTVTVGEAGDAGATLILSRAVDGQEMPLAAFPAAGPDPVVLYFLEGTARAMAAATGGSPFYIRNRIREALAKAGPGTATGDMREALVLPFADDPNRARMGDFADLALRFDYSDDPPRVLRLSADSAGAEPVYHDEMHWLGE